MKLLNLLFLFFLVTALSGCSLFPTPLPPTPTKIVITPTQEATSTMPPTPTPKPTITPTPQAQGLLNQMTLEQKVGQVFAIGFKGTGLDPELRELIEKYHIGGVIYFARNVATPQQVAKLNNEIQALALASGHSGLLIFVDQEGGRVARLTEDKGFTEFPSAMALGAVQNKETAKTVAQALGKEMKAVGFNADFAPVLDVNNNPANPVIGIRSFGSDPLKVKENGLAFIEGLQSENLLAFGKHFPGHGDTGVDSHIALPLVPYDRQRLDSVEFVPFRAAIAANVAGIMSAHVTFPAIDPTQGLPATLSSKVLTDLLRNEMGFKGLIVTDSLEMGALVQSGYPLPVASATALNAGADMLLSNSDYALVRDSYNLIMQWVKEGKIPMSRLDAAVTQVLLAKTRFGILQPKLVDMDKISAQVFTAETKQLSRQVAAQSITLLRDRDKLLPLKAEKIVVVETPAGRGLGRLLGIDSIQITEKASDTEISAVMNASSGRLIVLVSMDVALYPGQVKLVQTLTQAKVPLIVAAMRSPYDLLRFPEISTYLVTYGSQPSSLETLALVLKGQAKPQGHLPVEIPGLFPIGAGNDGFSQ